MPAISTTRRSCISPQRPRTAGVRSARDSVFGRGPERGDLLGEPRVGGDALVLGFAQTGVHAFQRVCDGLLEAGERCLGQIEKRRAIVLERLGRQRLERVAQPQSAVSSSASVVAIACF